MVVVVPSFMGWMGLLALEAVWQGLSLLGCRLGAISWRLRKRLVACLDHLSALLARQVAVLMLVGALEGTPPYLCANRRRSAAAMAVL